MLGPTASGKSEIALALAQHLGGEILSVDSMQVYRGMDIGTAKPSRAVRAATPHHLIDLVEPSEEFTVAEFQAAGLEALARLPAGAVSIIAGGSGLHFRSLVDPMSFAPSDAALRRDLEAAPPDSLVVELVAADPEAADHVDLANPRRVIRAVEIYRLTGETPSARGLTAEAEALRAYRSRIPLTAIGLDPGDRLAGRVEARFDAMVASGLVEEVAALAAGLGRTARQAVGYKELIPVVAGRCSLEAGRDAAIRATLALAKRQRTFFRRDPRIRWLPWHDDPGRRWRSAAAAVEEAQE